MILTKPQQLRFWRDWAIAKRSLLAQGWNAVQIETERHALIERAGFDSLTQVDQSTGFDRVLAELAAFNRPADLNAQLRQAQQPRTRLLYAIEQLVKKHFAGSRIESAPFRSTYVGSLMIDRFGHMDIDRLNLEQLEHLRNTLADRSVHEHKPETLARRRSRRHESAQTESAISHLPSAISAADPSDNEPF